MILVERLFCTSSNSAALSANLTRLDFGEVPCSADASADVIVEVGKEFSLAVDLSESLTSRELARLRRFLPPDVAYSTLELLWLD